MTGVPAPTGWEACTSEHSPDATVWRWAGHGDVGLLVLHPRQTSADFPHLADRVIHGHVDLHLGGALRHPDIVRRVAAALARAADWLDTQHPPPPPDGQRTFFDLEEASRG